MAEHMLRIAPDAAPRATILFVPPLFDEANRMRRTLVLAMRALATDGFAAIMPDLPGQNESLIPLEAVDLDRWRDTLTQTAAAIDGPVVVASVRGGALIDHRADAAAWWRLAPTNGAALLRTLLRARVAADREAGVSSSVEGLRESAKSAPLLLAGNLLSSAMVAQLGAAEEQPVAPLRSIGIGPDGIGGTPLWLRAEPGEDGAMAAAIAADIAAWSRACGIS